MHGFSEPAARANGAVVRRRVVFLHVDVDHAAPVFRFATAAEESHKQDYMIVLGPKLGNGTFSSESVRRSAELLDRRSTPIRPSAGYRDSRPVTAPSGHAAGTCKPMPVVISRSQTLTSGSRLEPPPWAAGHGYRADLARQGSSPRTHLESALNRKAANTATGAEAIQKSYRANRPAVVRQEHGTTCPPVAWDRVGSRVQRGRDRMIADGRVGGQGLHRPASSMGPPAGFHLLGRAWCVRLPRVLWLRRGLPAGPSGASPCGAGGAGAGCAVRPRGMAGARAGRAHL
jgi:hypothetical protein